ncbi:beta-lactamase domain-containing protein [Paenibacillus alvei TS-15]|uniref:Beta-lactamase domain-containing protein n=1 Tax=Paenibacillus alvei TS-15 TaxID=1117108 RepID=S9SNN2_PAEAL|nr:MBL fold metallo-hydrolase [Paenibacillus alvei]EPY07387.1 beta-lactamase domain-containing protein [Paenibacillus alvei TS-15]
MQSNTANREQHATKYPIVIDDPWFTVSKLDDSTFAISEYGHWERVHSFLLIGSERAALIDTGLGIDDITRMTSQLTSLPITVLTTHVHWDHIGSHGKFEHIYVHALDEDWLVNGIKGLPIEQVRIDVSRDITRPVPPTFDPAAYTPYQGKPTDLLQDGDTIDLGNRKLIVYHTPGHSPGHIVVHDTSRGYLFTGDLLYDETPIYAFYPSTSPEDLVTSWQKISEIEDIVQLFGSHNRLGLEPELLGAVKKAAVELREKDLVHFGTGVHQFRGFSVQF